MTTGASTRWWQRQFKALVLIGLTLVAYATAINRTQPLAWAIAALLLATLILGLAWPHWLVRRLAVVRSGPTRAEEGETVTFIVEIENRGHLPRFMVELVDSLPFVGAASGKVGAGETALGVVAYVPGKRRRRFEMPVLCEKRGHYQIGPIGLSSSFPLGLAEVRQRRSEAMQTLTIYPDVFTIVDLNLHGAPSQIHRGGYLLPEGSGAAEFSGLREYRRGDNPRHVHWPTTARNNELMVKEFEPLASACLCLALDLTAGFNVGRGKAATLEYAARIAASIAQYACSNALRVRLSGHGREWIELPPDSGEPHYQAILDTLAVVDANGNQPYAKVIERLAYQIANGETVVIFLNESDANAAATLHALALLRAKRAHLLAIVFDAESFASAAAGYKTVVKHAATQISYTGALAELGADCIHIKCGDDLMQVFNP